MRTNSLSRGRSLDLDTLVALLILILVAISEQLPPLLLTVELHKFESHNIVNQVAAVPCAQLWFGSSLEPQLVQVLAAQVDLVDLQQFLKGFKRHAASIVFVQRAHQGFQVALRLICLQLLGDLERVTFLFLPRWQLLCQIKCHCY